MPSSQEILLSGTIIYGDDFEPIEGYLCIRDGIIKELGQEKVEADLEGIISPRLFNAHTHIGDSVIKDPPFMPLAKLVGPGGLKGEILDRTLRSRLIEGMKKTLWDMVATGTWAFADFREGGLEGVEIISEALQGVPLESKILGRPISGSTEIHESCWGLGISSTRDHDLDILEQVTISARKRGQMVAIHAGESSDDDIADALSLNPDFLIHLNHASHKDLKLVADSDLPVVICPRSNLVTGSGLPDVKTMIDLGITVGIGTDNVMLNSANLFEEMALVVKALLHDDRQVFNMCSLNGAKIMGLDQRAGSILEGKEGKLMVIDRESNNMWGSSNPLASLVRRTRPSDIMAVF